MAWIKWGTGLLLAAVLYSVGAVAIIASGYSNFLYGQSYADGGAGFVAGFFAVSMDVLKCLLPLLILHYGAGAVRKGRTAASGQGRPGGTGHLIGLSKVSIWVFVLFSLVAGVSNLYGGAAHKIEGAADAAQARASALQDKPTVTARLTELREELRDGTKEALEGEIAALELDPIFVLERRSNKCLNATAKDSVVLCKERAELIGALGSARTAEAVQSDIASRAKRLEQIEATLADRTAREQASKTVDPFFVFLAGLSGVEIGALGLARAVLVVGGSELVILLAIPWASLIDLSIPSAKAAPVRRRKEDERDEAADRTGESDEFREWIEATTMSATGSRIPASQLLEMWNRHAATIGGKPCSANEFGARTKALGLNKAKIGGRMHYTSRAFRPASGGLRVVG